MLLAGCGLAPAAPPIQAPPPKLIGTYQADADPALPPLPPGFFYTFESFAFSPDDQWVAVALRAQAVQVRVAPIPVGAVLLLPLHRAGQSRIEIDTGAPVAALWSADSQSIVVQATLAKGYRTTKTYNLRGEPVWTGPQSGPLLGFIGPARLLAWRPKAKGGMTDFDTIDIRTSAVSRWRVPRNWAFRATDSERGLLAVFPDDESSKTLIVNSATGKVVQSLKNQNQPDFTNASATLPPFDWVYFAENGKTVCDAARIGQFKSYPVCRDVDTGKTIAEFRRFEGGQPADASTRGSRMVLTKLNYLPDGGFGRPRSGAESGNGRLVWDFRTGTEVAAWDPSMRVTAWVGRNFGDIDYLFAPVAISPSGNYVAERAGNELHIYRIP